jgi:hypothetical protein
MPLAQLQGAKRRRSRADSQSLRVKIHRFPFTYSPLSEQPISPDAVSTIAQVLFHGPNSEETKVEDRGGKERIGTGFDRALEIFERSCPAAGY